ncbi:MAG TPA: hypothetical protein VKZ77_00710 [Bacillaceae bacterium]|nr:hypothetical protein [Paenibacillus bovis]HLU20984.1 hypothetical protein [Bacillaceae bacterium]
MKGRLRFSIILPLCLLVCWSLYYSFYNGHNNKEKIGLSTEEENYGMSLKFWDDTHSLTPYQLTHIIQSEEKYKPNIEITNNYPESNKYRIFFFMDYQQISVEINKKKVLYLDVDLNPFEKESMMFTLPNITEGRHDFVIVVAKNYNNPLKVDETTYSNYLIRRTTIIKGKDADPNIKFTTWKNLNKIQSEPKTLFISQKPTSDISDISNISKPNFWLNIPTDQENFAMIGILDGQQIDISHNFIENGEFTGYLNIPISIQKTKKQRQNLFIATFNNPFQRMEDDEGNLIDFFGFELLNKVDIE